MPRLPVKTPKTVTQPALLEGVKAKKVETEQHIAANRLNEYAVTHIIMRGGYAWRNNTGAGILENPTKPGLPPRRRWISFGEVGSSDVIGWAPDGRFIAVETKTPRDKLSDKQKEFLNGVRNAGGIALVVTGRDCGKKIDEAMAKSPTSALRHLVELLKFALLQLLSDKQEGAKS